MNGCLEAEASITPTTESEVCLLVLVGLYGVVAPTQVLELPITGGESDAQVLPRRVPTRIDEQVIRGSWATNTDSSSVSDTSVGDVNTSSSRWRRHRSSVGLAK